MYLTRKLKGWIVSWGKKNVLWFDVHMYNTPFWQVMKGKS